MRPLPEWIGATPETAIPPRVELRIVLRQDGKCVDCRRKFGPKLKPQMDHRPALINGGENRESMIEAVCVECHKVRTKTDVAEKAKVARVQAKHLGICKARNPMPGSRASGLRKRMDGTVERR